jgi:hypothetical protein
VQINYGQEVTDCSFEPEPIGAFAESLNYMKPTIYRFDSLIDLMVVSPAASPLTSNRLSLLKITISATRLLATASVPNIFTAMHISLMDFGDRESIAAHTPPAG